MLNKTFSVKYLLPCFLLFGLVMGGVAQAVVTITPSGDITANGNNITIPYNATITINNVSTADCSGGNDYVCVNFEDNGSNGFQSFCTQITGTPANYIIPINPTSNFTTNLNGSDITCAPHILVDLDDWNNNAGTQLDAPNQWGYSLTSGDATYYLTGNTNTGDPYMSPLVSGLIGTMATGTLAVITGFVTDFWALILSLIFLSYVAYRLKKAVKSGF